MDVLVSLCKRRGFVFQSSEIYGGTGSCWDYGPLGVELKQQHQAGVVAGLRAAARRHGGAGRLDPDAPDGVEGERPRRQLHRSRWSTAGSASAASGPTRSTTCRGSHYCEATKGNKFTIAAGEACKHCGARRTLCPECGKGELTAPRQFNLMFKTFMGPVEEDASVTYLRPETAQGIFVNFDNVLQSTRRKLPFGIAQIGKAFRNEITPGNFIFRTREFEQMEIEFFVNPHETLDGRPADEAWHDRWIDDCQAWFARYGLQPEHVQAARARAGRAGPLLQAHGRPPVPVPDGLERAHGHRQPHGLRPQAAREVQRQVAHVVRRGAQGARGAVRDRAVGGRRSRPARLPARRLSRGGGPGREAGRPALPSRAGAGQDRGAAAAQEAAGDRGHAARSCAPAWPGAG